MLKIDRRPVLEQSANPHDLYDRYGDMLLGYILEIVKDRTVAEQYLIKIFCDLSKEFHPTDWDHSNSKWIQLQRFAKSRLAIFTDTTASVETSVSGLEKHTGNRHLEKLNYEQRKVFCDVYYHTKKITEIAKELNKTEDTIRKTLKEAFAIIKNDSGN